MQELEAKLKFYGKRDESSNEALLPRKSKSFGQNFVESGSSGAFTDYDNVAETTRGQCYKTDLFVLYKFL